MRPVDRNAVAQLAAEQSESSPGTPSALPLMSKSAFSIAAIAWRAMPPRDWVDRWQARR